MVPVAGDRRPLLGFSTPPRPCLRLGSTRSDFECGLRACSALRVSLAAGPPPRERRDHSNLASRPSRVFVTSRPSEPSLGPTPLRSSAPPTVSLGLAPCWGGPSTPAPVPLSGFRNPSAVSWQARASRPCFMPQPFLGPLLPLSRAFPPQRSRAPLEAACSLAVIHPRVDRADRGLVAAGFADARARARWPVSPDDYGLPFSDAEASPPGPPGPRSTGSVSPRASPASKPSSPCGSVRADRSRPRPAAAALLSFSLSRAFSAHASDPRTRPGSRPSTPRRPRAPARDAGDLATPRSGEPTPEREEPGRPRRQHPAPFGTGPRHLSAALLPPTALVHRAHPAS